ncbi:MAG: hypothetical protein ABI741_15200 [Ferruginibacter sp.]
MKEKAKSTEKQNKPETIAELKNQATADEGVMKGYNEKNPGQPQGAFKPDNAVKKKH